MFKDVISRREFVGKAALIALLATPVGRYLYEKFKPVPSRKLRAVWTSETAQDMKYYHGLDAEQELIALLSKEIKHDFDHEVITQLRNNV